MPNKTRSFKYYLYNQQWIIYIRGHKDCEKKYFAKFCHLYVCIDTAKAAAIYGFGH